MPLESTAYAADGAEEAMPDEDGRVSGPYPYHNFEWDTSYAHHAGWTSGEVLAYLDAREKGAVFFAVIGMPAPLAGAPAVSDSSCSHGAGGSGKKQLRLRQNERGRDPDAEKEAWSSAAKALSGKAKRSCIEGGVGYASIPLALYYESDKTVDHQVQAALDLGESVRAHLRVAVRREEEMHQGILNAKRERALLKLREREQKAIEKREKTMVKEERGKTKEESSRLCNGTYEGDQGSGVRHTGSACRKRAKRSKSPGKPLLDSLHGHLAARTSGSAGPLTYVIYMQEVIC